MIKGRSQKNFSLYIIKKVRELSSQNNFIYREDNVVVTVADTVPSNLDTEKVICLYQKNITNIFMTYG